MNLIGRRKQGGFVAILGRAARVAFWMIVYGILVLHGGILLSGSLAAASRQHSSLASKYPRIIEMIVLLPYFGLATYWWRRLLIVLMLKRSNDNNTKRPADKPTRPGGIWDRDFDEV